MAFRARWEILGKKNRTEKRAQEKENKTKQKKTPDVENVVGGVEPVKGLGKGMAREVEGKAGEGGFHRI